MLASREAQTQLLTSWGGYLFLFGKIVRFLLYFVVLFSVLSKTNLLVGYTKEQVILFFLVFNLVDVVTQALFRGVYRFRPLIVRGNFDFDLLRPLPSFFRPVFGWTDIWDLITLVPLFGYFWWFIERNSLLFSNLALIVFFLIFFSSLVLSFSFHLLICGICVLTTEIDHLTWVYRDLTGMARFPTDIYPKSIQSLLTFVIPVVVLITFPAKALLGLLSWQGVALSLAVSSLSLLFTFRFWRYALKRYSSASS